MARVRLVPHGSLEGKVRVPPSKSYTHRALVFASLARGTSRVSNPLVSRDTLATMRACAAMGATLSQDGPTIDVTGSPPRTPDDVVNVENSGTTLRLMTSVFSLAPAGFTILTGDSSIRERPMQPLLDALSGLGVRAWSARGNGRAPVVVEGGRFKGGSTAVDGRVSSQYVSSILAAAPLANGRTSLRVTDAVSRPYIDATLRLSQEFGARVERDGYARFDIQGGQEYRPTDFTVPSDFSSASFPMAAVALLGGRVEFEGLSADLPQGDASFIGTLRSMGVGVSNGSGSIVVQADGRGLGGGTFDVRDTPDLLPVLAVLALKCDRPVSITGAAHARFKETDRISVLAQELTKVGARVQERPDGMTVAKPESLAPKTLDAHGDHRMFMAFSLASLLAPGGLSVEGEESLDVSYPGYLDDMEALGAEVKRD